MTAEIRLAFDHPEARSAATAVDAECDRISLRDYVVEVEIGAFQAERGTDQHIQFNIVVELKPCDGPIDDDVDRILSYDVLTEAIDTELAAERLNLLETLAERVADRILLAPRAGRVFVRIEKLDRGPGKLGVEIVRSGQAAAPVVEEVPHPVVIYLTNAAVAWEGLTAFIDEMQSTGAALIFCVGLPDDAPTISDVPAVQRRIDLLAIEQNAWVLAGRDTRCFVVGTRTELDWAMKNGQISTWAPSKMVLDAVDGPSAGPRAPLALAEWFASEMQAQELICVGADAPTVNGLPSRRAGF